MTSSRPARHFAVSLVVALILLLAWEGYARTFAAMRATPTMPAEELMMARARQQSSGQRRVAIFGSSQIANVKFDSLPSPRAIPFRLADALAARGVGARHEVLDLSAPGQNTVEMMAMMLGMPAASRLDAVVIGAGMFSMKESQIRPAIRGGFDPRPVRAAILAAQLDTGIATRLLSFIGEDATKADSTVQQRTDARLREQLEGWSAAMSRRQTMYDRLVDQPVRRDLVAKVRRARGERTARTIGIGPEYAPSLAAIDVIAAYCAAAGVPLYVVVLPFDATRSPLPQTPETQARLLGDLRRMSAARGFTVLDLGASLTPAHFGDYTDGSPDGLHFDARGHQLVADSIASLFLPAVQSPKPKTRS